MRETLLPNRIAELLEGLALSRQNYSRAVAMIEYYTKLLLQGDSVNEYFATSVAFFRKCFGVHYLKTLQALKGAGIVQCNESYKSASICGESSAYPKGYRINPDLLDAEFKLVKYKLRKEDCTDLLSGPERTNIIIDLSKLEVDYKGAASTIDEHVDSLEFIIGEDVEEQIFRVKLLDRFFWVKREEALKIATSEGKQLIQYNDRFYIADRTEFIRETKRVVRFAYTRSIARLKYKIFYAKRNSTNRRIDTNLTSMPSKLVPHLRYLGQPLSSLDLSNSQLAIFAAILRNPTSFADGRTAFFMNVDRTGATEKFLHLCETGNIYEAVAKDLNSAGTVSDAQRKNAKTNVLGVIFSSHKAKGPVKTYLKEKYPDVINAMDGFKAEYGDNEFAILLQRIESEIFIDGIYRRLKDLGITCWTKHDSILFNPTYYDVVNSFMLQVFDRYGIRATVKHEGYDVALAA